LVQSTLSDMIHANELAVADRFAGNVAIVAAAAEKGDLQARFYMFRESYVESFSDEMTARSVSKIVIKGGTHAILWMAICSVKAYLDAEKNGSERDVLEGAMLFLKSPAARSLATAQCALGMLIYCSQCDSGAKADLLDAARWIRKAAMQGIMDAQYELGEMFRHGVFCDHIYMRFARKYIRRASVQGHVEANACMKELRSCVICGAADAKLACSLCHQARYCDSQCSLKHWCEGGGVGGGVSGGAATRHKDTCPRTHARCSH